MPVPQDLGFYVETESGSIPLAQYPGTSETATVCMYVQYSQSLVPSDGSCFIVKSSPCDFRNQIFTTWTQHRCVHVPATK